METRSADNRIWTRVSDASKHAAAGMRLGSVGTKPGGGGEDQPYDGHAFSLRIVNLVAIWIVLVAHADE